jgi:hypothetical protein
MSEAGRWAGYLLARGRKGKERRVWARGDLGMKEKGFHFFPFKFWFEVSNRFKFKYKLFLNKTKI